MLINKETGNAIETHVLRLSDYAPIMFEYVSVLDKIKIGR